MAKEIRKSGRPISSAPPWGELFAKVGQEKIADELGVSKSTVGKWAREIHRVPELARRELLRLCKRHSIKENAEIFDT